MGVFAWSTYHMAAAAHIQDQENAKIIRDNLQSDKHTTNGHI